MEDWQEYFGSPVRAGIGEADTYTWVDPDSDAPNGTVEFIDDEQIVLRFDGKTAVVYPSVMVEQIPDGAVPVVMIYDGVPDVVGWTVPTSGALAAV